MLQLSDHFLYLLLADLEHPLVGRLLFFWVGLGTVPLVRALHLLIVEEFLDILVRRVRVPVLLQLLLGHFNVFRRILAQSGLG